MTKCLVTKLKGVVNDDSFVRYGEFRINISPVDTPSAATQGLSLQLSKATTLEIVGDGYFTDKYLAQNLGKSLTIAADTDTDIYVSNGSFQVSVPDKYIITTLRTYAKEYSTASSDEQSGKAFSINDLQYSTGLAVLVSNSRNVTGNIMNVCTKAMTTLNLSYTSVVGSLINTPSFVNLTELQLANTLVEGAFQAAISECKRLRFLDLSNSKAGGRLDYLSDLTELVSVKLTNTNTKGSVSSLAKLTKLFALDLYGTSVSCNVADIVGMTELVGFRIPYMTGNISQLAALTKLKTCTMSYAQLTGDLSKMPDSCFFVSFEKDQGSSLSWTSRPASACIMAMDGTASLANCDQMIIDQAAGVVAIPESGESWYKRISISGEITTTTAYTAMLLLVKKGYTVSIPVNM